MTSKPLRLSAPQRQLLELIPEFGEAYEAKDGEAAIVRSLVRRGLAQFAPRSKLWVWRTKLGTEVLRGW